FSARTTFRPRELPPSVGSTAPWPSATWACGLRCWRRRSVAPGRAGNSTWVGIPWKGGLSLRLSHQLGKPAEQMTRIVRTGRRLRMVLNAERLGFRNPEPFYRPIIQVHVRDHGLALEALRIDGEAVVLGGDLDPSRD